MPRLTRRCWRRGRSRRRWHRFSEPVQPREAFAGGRRHKEGPHYLRPLAAAPPRFGEPGLPGCRLRQQGAVSKALELRLHLLAQICLILSPSAGEITPMRPISKDCSRQSILDKRTVDGRRKPAAFQSASVTSNSERGVAVVTAAATKSELSSHRTNVGRFLEPRELVNGMSATQNSPGRIVIIEPFILRRVTIQQRGMIANLALAVGFTGRSD